MNKQERQLLKQIAANAERHIAGAERDGDPAWYQRGQLAVTRKLLTGVASFDVHPSSAKS